MKYYTGIGARDTPASICEGMSQIGAFLQSRGYILRSGGAEGADTAFAKFVDVKEIYLPWKNFNGNTQGILPPFRGDFVEKYHPRPKSLSESSKKLMSRNTYQVLGQDLNTKSEFVICWTKDGKASGGTGQAMRIAKDYGIPIYNMNGDLEQLKDFLKMISLTN